MTDDGLDGRERVLGPRRQNRWWDYAILAAQPSVIVWLGLRTVVPPLAMDVRWIAVLGGVLLLSLIAGTWSLWKRTRFAVVRKCVRVGVSLIPGLTVPGSLVLDQVRAARPRTKRFIDARLQICW